MSYVRTGLGATGITFFGRQPVLPQLSRRPPARPPAFLKPAVDVARAKLVNGRVVITPSKGGGSRDHRSSSSSSSRDSRDHRSPTSQDIQVGGKKKTTAGGSRSTAPTRGSGKAAGGGSSSDFQFLTGGNQPQQTKPPASSGGGGASVPPSTPSGNGSDIGYGGGTGGGVVELTDAIVTDAESTMVAPTVAVKPSNTLLWIGGAIVAAMAFMGGSS